MNHSILLVEDNPGDSHLIRSLLLEQLGLFTVTIAPRLELALRAMAEERPDVVLLDLHLPDSHGLSTFDTLRERGPDVPIVVLTGLNDPLVEVEVLARGAEGYVLKDLLSHAVASDYLARVLRCAIGSRPRVAIRQVAS